MAKRIARQVAPASITTRVITRLLISSFDSLWEPCFTWLPLLIGSGSDASFVVVVAAARRGRAGGGHGLLQKPFLPLAIRDLSNGTTPVKPISAIGLPQGCAVPGGWKTYLADAVLFDLGDDDFFLSHVDCRIYVAGMLLLLATND